jgi:hypothetical protein
VGIGVACTGAVIRGGCLQCLMWTLSCKCNASFILCLHVVSIAELNVFRTVHGVQIVRFGSRASRQRTRGLSAVRPLAGRPRERVQKNRYIIHGLLVWVNSANDRRHNHMIVSGHHVNAKKRIPDAHQRAEASMCAPAGPSQRARGPGDQRASELLRALERPGRGS